jgi:amidophosphoribosyltransferase
MIVVRGTTLKMSIKMMDRIRKGLLSSHLHPNKYPDCYGIDMAKLEGLVAFRAALDYLKKETYIILLRKSI